MPYIVNPNDPTTPTNDQGATQGAEELRALKAVIAGLVVAALAAPAVRQAIQSANLDANGYNNAITVGAGLRPGLTASVGNEYQLSFAAGFSGGKGLDFNESFNANIADILGVDLPLSNTSYLFRNYATGWGSTLVPPQYGYTFDRSTGALLNFEGVNGAVATTDDFGNSWTFNGNAQLTTAQFKFGAASLLLDGTGDYITTTAINTVGSDSWTIETWFRINALPGVGANTVLVSGLNVNGLGLNLYLNNNAGTTKLAVNLSSDGTTNNIALISLGANTVWTLNQWNKVRFVFNGSSYKVYLSLNGAAETTDISIASALVVCSPMVNLRIGASSFDGTQGWNGWIDAFRFVRCATNTSTETPAVVAPVITDYKYNFFSIPLMKMFEVTAASGIANTNPTLTATNRLFVGEADTSGVAVTAVRNYALRGDYVSDTPFQLAASTITTKNHNIGTIPKESSGDLINIIGEFGFKPGDVVHALRGAEYDGALGRGIQHQFSRCTMTIATSTALPVVFNLATGAVQTLSVANWRYRVNVKRGW